MVYYILHLLTLSLTVVAASRVLELSDKFTEIRKDGGYWLVKFYAPWCGHCKRLEPVWSHVAQALTRTNIRVAKIDCVRFPSVRDEFDILGYPTIKFIKPDADMTYHGDRTKEDIINFATRLAGPPVQQIERKESLTNVKNMNQLFFTYVGERIGELWDTYYSTALKLQAHAFFYSASEEIVKQHVDIDEIPSIFVYKEGVHYIFSRNDEISLESTDDTSLNSSLYKWINEERFDTFPKITHGNINELVQTNKFIVLVVVEEDRVNQIPQVMLQFRNLVESVIRRKRDKFHKYFQFGWVASPDLANSIAMQKLPLPHLLVLNSTTYHHHIPEDDPTEMTFEVIDDFLESIINSTAKAYGGQSFVVKLYRVYYEATTAIGNMWRGNPSLTTVIFGVPLGFGCLILYSCCCTDIIDAKEDDEEDDEDQHEKRE